MKSVSHHHSGKVFRPTKALRTLMKEALADGDDEEEGESVAVEDIDIAAGIQVSTHEWE